MRKVMASYYVAMFLFATFGVFDAVLYPKMVHTASSYQKNEVVNGLSFTYKEYEIDGNQKIAWLIEDRAVSMQEYTESLADAYKEESKRETEEEFTRRQREHSLKLQAKMTAQKKIINNYVVVIEDNLKKLHEYGLESFLVFSDNTLPSKEQLDELEHTILAQAKELLDESNDTIELQALVSTAQKLESMPQRLNDLFYATVNKAISVCNDTKMLKKLLDTVA
jgi:hypothetical protein